MKLYDDYEHPVIEALRIDQEHGADHLSAIYDMLSGAAPLNVSDLYMHLDEVSGCLNWSMPYKPEHEDYLHSLIV